MSRRLIVAAVASAWMFQGCSSEVKPPVATVPQAPSVPPPSANAVDPSAKAQANSVAAYARDMEQAMSRKAPDTRPVAPPFTFASAAPLDLPKLDILEKPSAFELRLGPPQEKNGPHRTWEGLLETGAGEKPVANQPLAIGVPETRPTEAVADVTPPIDMRKQPPSFRDPPANPPVAAGPDELAKRLQQRLAADPRDLGVHLDLQLLQFIQEKPVPQLETLTALAPEDRELLSALLDSLVNLRTALRTPDTLTSRKVRPLLELADRLRGGADLRVSKIVLCSRVETFGRYEALSSMKFAAGRATEVIVYCDVENFQTRANERGMWESSLTQEMTLMTESGKPVQQDARSAVTDLSHNRRRDFYIARKMLLPATLAPGSYVLKVTVTDQLAQRGAQATLPIQIGEK